MTIAYFRSISMTSNCSITTYTNFLSYQEKVFDRS